MAEPTLKDVLNAISKMGARLDAKIEAVRGDVDALRSDVEAGFARVDERFDALDAKIDTVSGVVSSTREDTRDDLDALHKPLVRAKVPGVPKDLPSQVRAKDGRKPAARPARRR